jgi:dimethylhistidine N-methyltransferase
MGRAIQPATTCLLDGDDFGASLLSGLSKPRKTLPCRFLYDALGSELFEEITTLEEYYLTRAEISILERCGVAITVERGDEAVLVEFGSGSSRKSEILLRAMPRLAAYAPIDLAESALAAARARLAQRFESLDVRPIAADFRGGVTLPDDLRGLRKIGFFPGSTIGNFTPGEGVRVLGAMRLALSPDGVLIVGVDLKKDARLLLRAYNDSKGVTAAFNLNLLKRANRELGADFDISAFRHEAIYNPMEGRIEMHLVSEKEQRVTVGGRDFRFFVEETIHTENSYKFSIEQFRATARLAGWSPQRVWLDDDNLFSVHELLTPAPLRRPFSSRAGD